MKQDVKIPTLLMLKDDDILNLLTLICIVYVGTILTNKSLLDDLVHNGQRTPLEASCG